jgi:dTDP-4-dehydrorhamnose 3,5-epimerase-like enzyme
MDTIIESIKVHSDERGFIFEPLKAQELSIQRNAHIVVNMPGAVRGNHYHLEGTEIISVTGPASVRIREKEVLRDVEVPKDEVYTFTFPPGVSHAFKNTGNQPNILAAFNTLEHDPENPDVVSNILM